MNAYYRNDRRFLLSNVLEMQHDIRKRRRRAALARFGLYLGIATVLCGVLYFVAVGVIAQ